MRRKRGGGDTSAVIISFGIEEGALPSSRRVCKQKNLTLRDRIVGAMVDRGRRFWYDGGGARGGGDRRRWRRRLRTLQATHFEWSHCNDALLTVAIVSLILLLFLLLLLWASLISHRPALLNPLDLALRMRVLLRRRDSRVAVCFVPTNAAEERRRAAQMRHRFSPKNLRCDVKPLP